MAKKKKVRRPTLKAVSREGAKLSAALDKLLEYRKALEPGEFLRTVVGTHLDQVARAIRKVIK